MPRITVIPSTIDLMTRAPKTEERKRRVAAYARVSTDSEEQLTSYNAQKDYYSKYIKANKEWEFAGLYADEGISGTNTKKRDGFNTMIEDALKGKIDLIVTKSVSRFARNTVDSLMTIRKLKEHGVECFFEKENIYTFDAKGELLITLMSSLAQEESRSISENVKWGKRTAMSNGKFSLAYSSFLGYKKGEDGKLEIVGEEAEVVRMIYTWFLDGDSPELICRKLEKKGIKTPRGKDNWRISTVQSILTNEKYKGDALLQKSYVSDFLTKKVRKNNGEIKQYYVENSHPAIIPSDEWDCVQLEIAKRGKMGATYSSTDLFLSRLKCGQCGGIYGKKVWHSNSPYRTEKYQCNHKFTKGKEQCHTETLTEEQITDAFIKAYNIFVSNSEVVIETCDIVIDDLLDLETLNAKIEDADYELKKVCAAVEKIVEENSKTALDQEEYAKTYKKLEDQYKKISDEYNRLVAKRSDRQLKANEIKVFKENFIANHNLISEWDRELWASSIQEATVNLDKTIDFRFVSGTIINVAIDKNKAKKGKED